MAPSIRPRLTVERLEPREIPASGLWTIEGFNAADPATPPDWSQWAPVGQPFHTGPLTGVRASGSLSSASAGRAWEGTVLPEDFAARAFLRGDTPAPIQVFIRGRDLDTVRPTYDAAELSAGGTVRLVRVEKGNATVLGAVSPATPVGGRWLAVTVRPAGDRLDVEVRRSDTGQFLTPAGRWQSDPVAAIRVTDGHIRGEGRAGVNRPSGPSGQVHVDDFSLIAPDLPPSYSFDAIAPGELPAGVNAWGNTGASGFAVSAVMAVDGHSLSSAGSSATSGRAWLAMPLPSNVTASATVLVNSLIPAQIILRGRDLDTPRPTYLAASVVRGTELKILRVTAGVTTELASLRTNRYVSGGWIDISFTAQGDRLQVRARRRDTSQWLNKFGDWQAEPAATLDALDSAVRGSGLVGLGRPASYSGKIFFDDFTAGPAVGDITPPLVTGSVTAISPAMASNTFAGIATLSASVVEAGAVVRVEFFIDGELVARRTTAPWSHTFETRDIANGMHALSIRAWDASGNVGETSQAFTVLNSPLASRPVVPRHYAHIRYAALAYSGNPMGAAEAALLRNSVDLVVPNIRYLAEIDASAPNTPQLIYSNLSNLYSDLLTDWLSFADRTKKSREEAFYHVAEATPFTGDSPSSQPVTWFWDVRRGPVAGTAGLRSLTSASHNAADSDVPFGDVGGALYMGYPDRFREVNITLSRQAGAEWKAIWEYPSSVDLNGLPTGWRSLKIGTDATRGLKQSGRLTFDPPADWLPATLSGGAARLLYVRLRTTAGSAATSPIAASILGRDYVAANGTKAGVIPAFDSRADANGDGYLTDAEFARRRHGFDARFGYESRLFYPYYGQMRFVTNPSGAGVAAWAANDQLRFLAANPLADGLFLDNSGGKSPTGRTPLVESTDTYTSDYRALLGSVGRAIAPKWLAANTAGGGTSADLITHQVAATVEEFALRPLAQTWSQVRDVADAVRRRLAATDPSGYLVLDSLSVGGSPTDARTRMAALAYYYLLADPEKTFLMTWGGEEPASAWSRHWFDAIAHDVGRPVAAWSEFTSGSDPANSALRYEVLQRTYDNALVLYKPLSYATGKGTGTLADASATTHTLPGSYRQLNADGLLGPAVTQIKLRNGEGVVLVKG